MNPLTFYGSKVDEHPQEFLDEVQNELYDMGLTSSDKAELASYQLKNVAQTWYVQWRDNRELRGGPVTWEIFMAAFIRWFLER